MGNFRLFYANTYCVFIHNLERRKTKYVRSLLPVQMNSEFMTAGEDLWHFQSCKKALVQR